MRLFASFLLTLLIYGGILFFFIIVISKNSSKKPKTVYVHQAIMVSKQTASKQKKLSHNSFSVSQKQVKKIIKKKEISSKDNMSKGGDYKLDDLFSSVNDNIPTTPIRHKQKQHITKKTSKSITKEVQQALQKLKVNMTVSNIKGNSHDKKYIQDELSKIWSEINTNIGDFVKIQLNISNANINVVVIATNLDTIRLNNFLSKIKLIDITKIGNVNAVIEFKSELKD